jgi:hypothetical protein
VNCEIIPVLKQFTLSHVGAVNREINPWLVQNKVVSDEAKTLSIVCR